MESGTVSRKAVDNSDASAPTEIKLVGSSPSAVVNVELPPVPPDLKSSQFGGDSHQIPADSKSSQVKSADTPAEDKDDSFQKDHAVSKGQSKAGGGRGRGMLSKSDEQSRVSVSFKLSLV